MKLASIIVSGRRQVAVICTDAQQAWPVESLIGRPVDNTISLNDVTARDLQHRHKQWFIAKSVDTFCPMGPWLVTADAVDPHNMELRCWVNSELRQQANTKDMIFDIQTLIATVSGEPYAGSGRCHRHRTPAGVGIGFAPPKYLRPGDEVAIEITGLGRLTNRVARR